MNNREYISPKVVPKDTVYNFESIRLQKIQENQQTEPTRGGTPIKSVPKGNLNAQFRAMHDTSPPSNSLELIRSTQS